MFITHLIYALFIGLAIAWIFGLALGTRGPWNSFFWFFFVIFLFSWGWRRVAHSFWSHRMGRVVDAVPSHGSFHHSAVVSCHSTLGAGPKGIQREGR